MTWIDKLRGIFEEKQAEKAEEKKEISLDKLGLRLAEEEKIIAEKIDEAKKLMIERTRKFSGEISEQIKNIERLDISKIREKENLKGLVKEGIRGYAESLRLLLENLREIEKMRGEEYIKKSGEIIIRSDKVARSYFEKATILIGKEMAQAREITSLFFKELGEIALKSGEFSGKTELILELRRMLSELENGEEESRKIERDIEKLCLKTESLKKEREKMAEEMKKTEDSEEYKKNIEENEKRRKETAWLENEVRLMKQKIDFRALAKQLHGTKKAGTVKEYADNFIKAMENDDNLEIIDLAEGVNLEELREIKKKLNDIKNYAMGWGEMNYEKLKKQIEAKDYEIREAEMENAEKLKIKEKLKEKIEKTSGKIREKAGRI